jgi:hypothetical protein
MALSLALIMELHKVESSLIDVLDRICWFSYKGDIRMRFKMENPKKVRNIVEGSFNYLSEIYKPLLQEFEKQGILTFNEEDDTIKVIIV